MKRNDYCLPCLFGNSKCSTFGAFFRKNLSMIRHGKFTLLQFVLAMVSPVLFGIVANSLESMPIVIIEVLLLSAIPSVTNIYFIFYSSLFENRNKVNEILQIRNFSFAKRVTEKAVSAGIVSSVLCTVSFFIITIFFTSNFVLLLLTIINCFISSILCSFYSCNIHSFKAENVHKSVISFISIALQSVLLVFV